MLNPPLDTIDKNTPVCQFPRASYNRITEIINHLKAGRGVRIVRDGDKWTLNVDAEWLTQIITAIVSPIIDAAENEVIYNLPPDAVDTVTRAIGPSSGTTASTTTWAEGDTNSSGAYYKPYVRLLTRIYWDSSTHNLLYFYRDFFFDHAGRLTSITREYSTSAFTSVAENL